MHRTLTVLLTLALTTQALAWNKAGHMVSGAIAYAVLKQDHPDTLAKVVELLKRTRNTNTGRGGSMTRPTATAI